MKLTIAKKLIENGCVKLSPLNPFTYASGLVGPIYCDNRLILSHIDFRELVIDSFLDVLLKNKFNYDYIAGIATAGIPHASFIADRLKKPLLYVRPKPKEHGKQNQIEGDFKVGSRVVLVEDLVNQGASLAEAMAGINNAQLLASDCLCVVDYQMPEAKKRMEQLNLNLHSLTDFDHLVIAARELQFIDSAGEELLYSWHSDPKNWSKRQA